MRWRWQSWYVLGGAAARDMYIHMHVHIHIHKYVYVYIYICMSLYIYIHIVGFGCVGEGNSRHVFAGAAAQEYVFIDTHICIGVPIYIYTHTCMHTCIIYIHIYLQHT